MERRYDLDALRVIAFGLLIFYHIGMFFVPWEWHIKNNVIYHWIEVPMLFLNRWRMPLLFIISGMGVALSLQRRTTAAFSRERLQRLLLPLVFGILVIVPPQVYVERIAYNQFSGSYFDFLSTQAYHGEYPKGNISWHHLWFIPYILVYSFMILLLHRYFKSHPNAKIFTFIQRQMAGKWSIYTLLLPLFLMECFLDPFFPVTHALVGDWYNFTYSFTLFVYGYMFIQYQKTFFTTVQTYYKSYLYTGIVCFTVFIWIVYTFEDGYTRHYIEASFNQVNMWSWLLFLFGVAAKYLNQPNAFFAYCNTAVYPFYILHQTVIVVLAYFLIEKPWGLATKFGLLTLGTALSCWLLYDLLIKRFKLLRLAFGLKI